MYKIINVQDNSVIGTTENPCFIKKKPSTGCYIQTNAKSAQGIVYLGTVYNLQGREPMGVEETVVLLEVDGGSEVDKTAAALAENSAAIDNIIISMLEG